MHLPKIYRFISPRVEQVKEKIIGIPLSEKKVVSAHRPSNQSLRTILPKYPSILWKIHQPGYVTSHGPLRPPLGLRYWISHFLLPILTSLKTLLQVKLWFHRGSHLALKLSTGWLYSQSSENYPQKWGSIAQWTDKTWSLGWAKTVLKDDY